MCIYLEYSFSYYNKHTINSYVIILTSLLFYLFVLLTIIACLSFLFYFICEIHINIHTSLMSLCTCWSVHFLLQNLISAATGMNLTTVDDPIQRKFLPSFLRGVAEENKLITSPNFVVTQALVALLADKGARLRPAYDKADLEKRGL